MSSETTGPAAGAYDTRMGGWETAFPATQWSKVLSASRQQAVLAELCQRYWKPLYRFVRGKGYASEAAKDLVQGFFTDKVLGRDLFGRADQRRGRFRTFLLRALQNYLVDRRRAERRHESVWGEDFDPPGGERPETAFHRAWAAAVLQRALADLAAECAELSQPRQYRLFHAWLIDPELPRPSMAALCQQFGLGDAAAGYQAVARLKARFRDIVRRNLTQEVGAADVEDELRHFLGAFS